jgi:hypothetical protein
MKFNTMPKQNTMATPRRAKGPRRARKARPSFTIQKNIAPDDICVSLKYGDAWDLSGGAVDYAANIFRLNSLYDPDLSGAGGQPSGFDYWTTAYYRYKVFAADISVIFTNTTNTQSFGAVTHYGTGFTAPATGTEVQQSVLEGDHTKGVVLAPTGNGNDFIRGVVRIHCDLRKLQGDAAFNDSDTSAIYNANPAIPYYAQVAVCAWNGTTVGPSAVAVVQIVYHTLFTQRRQLYED